MFKKTLIAEFFTTVSTKQYIESLYLMTIWLPFLRKWEDTKLTEKKILKYLWVKDSKIISFYNWRSAIYHTLKNIGLNKKSEVIVSWYTCVSVSNAVIQSWAKIIYSDIEKKSLWFDIVELENNINSNTKAIIVQHTFWKPSNIKKIAKLAKEKNIVLIEDCAHSLWSSVEDKKLGTFWDFSIFSTWRDKVISSVTGWFLVINNPIYNKIKSKIEKKLILPSRSTTLQNLNYNLAWKEAYSLYDCLKIGKIVIFLSRKLKLITEILTLSEKNCWFKNFNYKLPNSLSLLAWNQIKRLNKVIKHNQLMADYYNENIKNIKITKLFKSKKTETNNYFRYPILLKNEEDKNKLYLYMKKHNILLWNTWSWINIVPLWSNIKKAKYIKWTCPIAEDLSKRILTLPNHYRISKKDIQKITKLINKF